MFASTSHIENPPRVIAKLRQDKGHESALPTVLRDNILTGLGSRLFPPLSAETPKMGKTPSFTTAADGLEL